MLGASIFVGKSRLIVFVQMWLRWTLPRPRIDQVLYACVKVLLPLSCVLLLGAAVWQLFVPSAPYARVHPGTVSDLPAYNPWLYLNPWNFAEWFRAGAGTTLVTQVILTLIGVTLFTLVVAWVGYSWWTGRRHILRLTDPAPIERVPENLAKA